ncbi:MAG TPA: response regulator [Gemmatimonadaceae bacterium]|nr:response regulator [Gemmatimonadaceae bacterium]
MSELHDGGICRRILVADDSATAREWLRRRLEGRYEVSLARDGNEAVVSAIAARPDLILLDVEMPGVDGLAACRALRSMPATRAVPIILVTSHTEPFDVESGFASGCTDYIGKPVDETELIEKVASWVEAGGVSGGGQ